MKRSIERSKRKTYHMIEKNIRWQEYGGIIPGCRTADLSCGKCGSVLLGYDEVICPSCGAYNYVK